MITNLTAVIAFRSMVSLLEVNIRIIGNRKDYQIFERWSTSFRCGSQHIGSTLGENDLSFQSHETEEKLLIFIRRMIFRFSFMRVCVYSIDLFPGRREASDGVERKMFGRLWLQTIELAVADGPSFMCGRSLCRIWWCLWTDTLRCQWAVPTVP